MSAGRWVGFGLVWLALMIMSGHGLHRANASRRDRLVAEPV
jgi:chloramphenicol-sensitive protein RarD